MALGLLALTGVGSATAAVAATPTSVATAVISTAAGDSAADSLRSISERAVSTLDAARVTLAKAAEVNADVAASDLELSAARTVISTDELRTEIDRLSALDVIPALLLPSFSDDTAAVTKRVAAQSTALRTALETAKAEKAAADAAATAAAEAAAQAQRDAEAAAAAAAALAAANTPEGAQAVAQQMASANYGWGSDQFSCLVSLWNKESGWNYQAYNSSGATGIPQALPGSKMASAGSDWETNATTQITWGLEYISAVYGTPCSAWSHSQSTNWY